MIIRAEQTYSRQTPTRLRLVAAAVKKLSIANAMDQLEFMNKKAADTLLKVFKQAVANAKHNAGLSIEELTIKDIVVNEGPHFKRFQAVSRGRAHAILKRTSHIRVELESKEQEKAVKSAKQEKVVEAPKTAKKPATTSKKTDSKKTKTTTKAVKSAPKKKTGDK